MLNMITAMEKCEVEKEVGNVTDRCASIDICIVIHEENAKLVLQLIRAHRPT